MKKKNVFNMVLFSTFASIILLMGLIPELGFITFIPGISSITIVHIPVLIGVMLLPLGYSMMLGLMFGLSSWIASFMYAKTAFDYAFQNPLVSVVPRILFAVAAFFVVRGLIELSKRFKHGNIITFILITIISSIFMFFAGKGLIEVTGWKALWVYLATGLLLVALLGLYLFYLLKRKDKKLLYVPSSFILSTLLHTLLVLTMVAIFKPVAYGENADIMGIILMILGANGMIEPLAAILIGTPIVFALMNLIDRKEDYETFV